MSPSSSAPGGESRLALTAGVGCYLIWGFIPLLFQMISRLGAGPWEILAQRTIWSIPVAGAFVLAARQGGQVAAVFRRPRVLGLLALSALLIAINWIVYIWAVTHGQVLEASLGYYINPLLNMAAGIVLFRERIDRLGMAAIALAAVGVAVQTFALGHFPVTAVTLALAFAGYGVVRKKVAADAQTGFLVECLILAAPCLAYIAWFSQAGEGHFLASSTMAGLMVFSGAATAVPLVLFAWAARRIPLSMMGFLQFIAPTIVFAIGVVQGEPLTFSRIVSFAFIWAGALVFVYGAWRRARLAAI